MLSPCLACLSAVPLFVPCKGCLAAFAFLENRRQHKRTREWCQSNFDLLHDKHHPVQSFESYHKGVNHRRKERLGFHSRREKSVNTKKSKGKRAKKYHKRKKINETDETDVLDPAQKVVAGS